MMKKQIVIILTIFTCFSATAQMKSLKINGTGFGNLRVPISDGRGVLNYNNQSSGLVLASPSGSVGPVSLRALVSNDIPSLDAAKITTGTFPTTRVANIYNTSSTLTGNRIASGSGGTYGIKWDSVAYFNILSGDQFQGFANYIHQADNFGARFSTTPSSTPFLDLTLDRADSSLTVKVPNGSGGSKLLKMKKDTLSYDGRFKYKWGLPGVGKTIIDSTGNGDMVWRNSTPTSPGTPTFSPSGSVNLILGSGYSVTITGSGDHMKIQIVTGTGITSNGTIGNIMLSTPYSSTPVVVSSPAEIGSIGAPVGFNGTSASSIIIFNSSVLLPSTTYYFNLITGL